MNTNKGEKYEVLSKMWFNKHRMGSTTGLKEFIKNKDKIEG